MKAKKETIVLLREFCFEYINVYEDFAESKQGQTQTTSKIQESVSRDFIIRNRVHIESIYELLGLLNKHQHFKSSLFLILRGVIADILTYLYLMTFTTTNENDQTSLINELNILEKDFVAAMLALHNERNKMKNFSGLAKYFSGPPEKAEELILKFKFTYAHLFENGDIENKLKDVTQLRKTSDIEFFNKDIKMISKSFKSEIQKHDWLLKFKNYENMAPLYSLYKYFSQFHHYSRGSMVLYENDDFEQDIFYIIATFSNLLKVTDLQFKVLVGTENMYSKKLDLADQRLVEIFK